MTKKSTSTGTLLATTMNSALFGAIVGGSAAAAKGINQIRKGEATKEGVALDVAKEAGTTAVAAGTASAVVGALGLGSVLSTLGIIAVATGAKYAIDTYLVPELVGSSCAPKKHAELQPAPVAKTAAATPKTAAKKSTPKKTVAKKAAPKKATAKKAAPKKAATKSTPAKKAAPKKTTAETK